MTNKNLLNPIQNAVLFNLFIKLCSIAKVSFIVGSQVAFFSLGAILIPLSGAFAGLAGCLSVFALRIALNFFLTAQVSLDFLAYHIPGLFASLHWATPSKYIRVIPAALCIVLFILHPTGSAAALYSLFWLIPIITAFAAKETLFMRSLGSTFTAHAVGSVIWVYTVPMSADQWLMLIPVVILERLLFACGMVIAYKMITYALKATSFDAATQLFTKNRILKIR